MVRPTYTTATIGQPIDDPRLTPYGPLHKAAGHFLVVRARKQPVFFVMDTSKEMQM